MSHTKARVLQYIVILLILAVGGGGYWYWQNAQAGVAQKSANNNGLVAYWSFDEGSGTKLGDASGNGKHATLGTAPQIPAWVDGKFGKALSFDGVRDATGDIVNIPSVVVGSTTPLFNTHTVSMWVYPVPAGHDVYQSLFDTSCDIGLYYHSGTSRKIEYYDANGGFSTGTLTENSWNHVVVVVAAGEATFYINNVAAGTLSGVAGYTATAMGGDSCNETFKGQIDETRVYSRALGAAEITNLYNLGAAKVGASQNSALTTGLVGLWSFDGADVSGVTAYDRSGNGNNGTLTLGPTTTIGRVGQALSFDGSNDYVDAGSAASLDDISPVTLSAWIYLTGTSIDSRIVTKDTSTGFSLFIPTGTTRLRWFRNFSGSQAAWQTADGAIPLNTWTYVSVTYDKSSTSNVPILYVNGVAISNSVLVAPLGSATSDAASVLTIGGMAGGSFSGKIDEVRAYSRILSASEVWDLYQMGKPDKVNSADSQTAPLMKGLAAYWKLDDASGTSATDASGNAYTGTLTSGPTWTTGQIGGATSFDGVDDYIDTNATLGNFGTGDFSVSVWFKTAVTDSYIISKRTVCSNASFWNLGVSGSALWAEVDDDAFGTNYNSINGVIPVNNNQWHHAVMVRSGARLSVYVDGIADGTASTAGTTNLSNAANLQIGKNICGSPFSGSADEARIYNRALSAEEITKLYKTTAPDNPDTGLTGYWPFNGPDISGMTAYDRSGKRGNGTLTNGPAATIGKIGQTLSFDGVDDFVDTGKLYTDFITPSTGTVSVWIRPRGAVPDVIDGNLYGIRNAVSTLSQFDAFGIGVGNLNSGGAKIFAFNNDGCSTFSKVGTSYTDNEWVHIVWMHSGGVLSLYKNGDLIGSVASADTDDCAAPGNLVIGTTWDGAGTFFNGDIDEVRTYNRALTQTEITSLYNSGR